MPDAPAHEEWQIAEVEAGLMEADLSEFATVEELSCVIAKYGSAVDTTSLNTHTN